jgi:hypothetical protein
MYFPIASEYISEKVKIICAHPVYTLILYWLVYIALIYGVEQGE